MDNTLFYFMLAVFSILQVIIFIKIYRLKKLLKRNSNPILTKKEFSFLEKKAMTLYDFNILSFKDKEATVCEFGSFIENKPVDNGTLEYLLYGIDKFFVEFVYNRDTNKIVEVHSFKTGKDLDKYLPDLNTLI